MSVARHPTHWFFDCAANGSGLYEQVRFATKLQLLRPAGGKSRKLSTSALSKPLTKFKDWRTANSHEKNYIAPVRG